MSSWHLTAGRLTLFNVPGPLSNPSALELFRKVWGQEPDNFQKHDNVLLPSTAAGRLTHASINCSVQAGRIDFNIGPPTPGKAITDVLPFIEDSKLLSQEFTRIASAVESLGVSTNRVALFTQADGLSTNFKDANSQLLELLPSEFKLHLGDEEDFVLQVNTPYLSEAEPKVRMNLIKKWAVQKKQVVSFHLPNAATTNAAVEPRVAEFIVPVFSIDINNTVAGVVFGSGATAYALQPNQLQKLLFEAMRKSDAVAREIGILNGN